jgi:hypothetical protein
MDFSIEIKPEGNILIATVVGELDEKAYVEMRNQVKASLEKTGAQHILLDLRRCVVQVSMMGVFRTAASNVEIFPPGIKYAVVYSAQTLPEDNAHFGETVARNRGAHFRVFNDMAVAQKWLGASGAVSK